MAKLKSEEKRKYQIVARILGVLTRIGSVCCWIAVGAVLLAAAATAVVSQNVKVDTAKKEVSVFNEVANYEIKDKDFEFSDEDSKVVIKDNVVTVTEKGDEILSLKISDKSIEGIESFVENDLVRILAVLPYILVLVAVLVGLYAMILGHGASVFKNIAKEETPFVKDNITRTEKAFKYSIATLVLAFVISLACTLATRIDSNNVSFSATSISSILATYVMIYIFKSGYKGDDKKAEKDEKEEE